MLRRGTEPVACIACGMSVDGDDAHEYHKHGDTRTETPPEYLCSACFDDLSPADRDGLEQLLCHLEAGTLSTREFLTRYADAVQNP